jgi:hypothetical protein
MRKVDSVVVIRELNTERKCKVVTLSLLFHAVLVVADIFASPGPSFSELASVYVAIHKWSHAVVVERVWL